MKVTGVKAAGVNNKEYAVYIDGVYAFDVNRKVAEDFNIIPGIILSQADIDKITRAQEFFRAYEHGLVLISYRKRSCQEVSMKLELKGFQEEMASEAVEALKKAGYLDDAEFALWWIESRRKGRPKGKIAVRNELKKRGVESSVIEKAFQMADERKPFDEIDMAFKAFESKAEGYRKLPYKTARRRISALLKRRGFSWDTVNTVLKRFFDENGGSIMR